MKDNMNAWKWYVAAAAIAVGAAIFVLDFSGDDTESELGPSWQCTTTALFIKTCDPVEVRTSSVSVRELPKPPATSE